jgi:hypothetical protein
VGQALQVDHRLLAFRPVVRSTPSAFGAKRTKAKRERKERKRRREGEGTIGGRGWYRFRPE